MRAFPIVVSGYPEETRLRATSSTGRGLRKFVMASSAPECRRTEFAIANRIHLALQVGLMASSVGACKCEGAAKEYRGSF